MQMAAGRWDMLAVQMTWIMAEPGKNPFVIEPAHKIVQMKAGDIARAIFGKVKS